MSINDQFKTLIENFKDEAEDIGFYLNGCNIAADHPEKLQEAEEENVDPLTLVENGEVNFAMFMEFDMRDHAFSDHVLNPEQVATDKAFEMIVPDSYETFKGNKLDSLDDFDE